jgi:hypothetical protein
MGGASNGYTTTCSATAGTPSPRCSSAPFHERDVEFSEAGWEDIIDKNDLGAHLPVVSDPSSFMLMVAGGSGAPLICKGWGRFGGAAVTRLVRPV